jgi:hypothetical protein
LLVVGPVFLLLGSMAGALAEGVAPGGDDAAVAVAAPTLTAASAILDWISVPTMLAWGLMVLVICRPWSPKAAWTGFVALTLQLCALASVVGLELLAAVLVQNGSDPAAITDAFDSGLTANPAGIFIFLMFMPTEVIALIAFGIALWRTRWVPRWVAIFLIALPFIDFAVNEVSKWMTSAAFGVLIVASSVIAARVLRDGAPRPIADRQTV